jgi:hypothetical protein
MAVKSAAINASSSGDNTVVAAAAGKRYRVIGYTFLCASAVSVKWKNGASADLTGAMPFAANGGITTPEFKEYGHFATSVGNALVLNLSGAVSVQGHVTYHETTG